MVAYPTIKRLLIHIFFAPNLPWPNQICAGTLHRDAMARARPLGTRGARGLWVGAYARAGRGRRGVFNPRKLLQKSAIEGGSKNVCGTKERGGRL